MASTFAVKTYDPKEVIVQLGGFIATDFPDGDFLTIPEIEGWEEAPGADGSEDRVNKNVTGVDVQLIVKQTSQTNDFLTARFDVDRLTNLGFFPFSVTDLGGTTIVFGAQSYVKTKGGKTFGNSISTVTWTIRVPQIFSNIGGNL